MAYCPMKLEETPFMNVTRRLEARDRLIDALERKIERLQQERLKLDRRIHNQRAALRQTWEIVEMRRKWLGSDTARKMYISLLKRYSALKAEQIGGAIKWE